jgi:hypothetical protein
MQCIYSAIIFQQIIVKLNYLEILQIRWYLQNL